MSNLLSETGWRQLTTLHLTADDPAVLIPITPTPAGLPYRKWCLAIPAAADVIIVTQAGDTISGILTNSQELMLYGVFDRAVQLFAYAAAPTAIDVTIWISVSGEIDDFPIPADGEDAVPWSVYEQAEVCFQTDHDADFGSYRVQNVAGTGAWNFTFHIPQDFRAVISINLGFFSTAGAAGAGKDIDLESMYCGLGEAYNTNNEVDTTSTYTLPGDGVLGAIDITGVFSNLEPGDCCGIEVDHNAIGGSLRYLGITMLYLRQRP